MILRQLSYWRILTQNSNYSCLWASPTNLTFSKQLCKPNRGNRATSHRVTSLIMMVCPTKLQSQVRERAGLATSRSYWLESPPSLSLCITSWESIFSVAKVKTEVMIVATGKDKGRWGSNNRIWVSGTQIQKVSRRKTLTSTPSLKAKTRLTTISQELVREIGNKHHKEWTLTIISSKMVWTGVVKIGRTGVIVEVSTATILWTEC